MIAVFVCKVLDDEFLESKCSCDIEGLNNYSIFDIDGSKYVMLEVVGDLEYIVDRSESIKDMFFNGQEYKSIGVIVSDEEVTIWPEELIPVFEEILS